VCKPEERDYLEDPGVDNRNNIKKKGKAVPLQA
jgi:hypothetical protein